MGLQLLNRRITQESRGQHRNGFEKLNEHHGINHENYQYSLVSGPDKSCLWILSRTPQMNPETLKRLVEKAAALGFDTGKLIFVEHDKSNGTIDSNR